MSTPPNKVESVPAVVIPLTNAPVANRHHHAVMVMYESLGETKGRKGEGVTLIKGLDMDAATLALMSKKLKVMCGSGGTVKEGAIEIQGDHIERILDYLKKQGVRAKRAGG